ncbi:MAG: polysaccharide deacetylase family protein [Prolixibacteraceae bacterium]
MIRLLTGLVYGLIRYSGLAALIRFLTRDRVSVILYHDPDPMTFEQHLQYLTRRYRPVSLGDLAGYLYAPGTKKLPDHALVVTFDDGWKGNYNLLPLFIKYGIRPAIFLSTGLIDTERHFWWTACSPKEAGRLKKVPNSQRIRELRNNYLHRPERNYRGMRQALSKQEILEMKEHVDFGLHTRFHPILTQCTVGEIAEEVAGCKADAEKLLGAKAEYFAYPNGDYDHECAEMLKASGIKLGRTTDAGWNDRFTNPYKLKVTGASDNSSITKLAAEMTGIPRYFQHLLLGGSLRGVKKPS